MKRRYFALMALTCAIPALTACGKAYDYTQHLSEVRTDIFRAETENYTVTISCVSREYPYLMDGISCPRSDLLEISLLPVAAAIGRYEVYVSGGGMERELGGEALFRNAHGDFFYSEGVTLFPEGSVNVRVLCGEEEFSLTATSVKNEHTLTAEQALAAAIGAERERVDRMTGKSGFEGEFYVRLLRRDRTYYYVGMIGTDGSLLSMLLDSETGEPLARRETRAIF